MGLTGKQRGRQMIYGGFDFVPRVYAADGAIAPNFSHYAMLTKAGVGAYTLAAPARDGISLTIVNRTANAHVVTATGLLDDGVTGGSKNTITMAAFAGASADLISYGGKWNTVGLKAATVA
jgi:hypothetical protein